MTFNYRYAPRNSSLRQVIASGEIGEVTSVHFEWALDTVHGADYFRRWHREKKNSGGLLVHKSSHHFDLVNWWLGDVPARVYARGGLKFYGDRNAADRGLGARPARGTGVVGDPFTLDLNDDPRLKSLYLDAEQHDGYLRDQDVFGPGITIEDNMALLVDYRARRHPDLLAQRAQPLGGLPRHRQRHGRPRGARGRRARRDRARRGRERGARPVGHPDLASATRCAPRGSGCWCRSTGSGPPSTPIPDGIGGHGGGDAILLKDVFRRHLRVSDDALGRPAGYLDGLRAVSVGIAANQSLVTGPAGDDRGPRPGRLARGRP